MPSIRRNPLGSDRWSAVLSVLIDSSTKEGFTVPGFQRGSAEYRRVTLALFLGALSMYASLYATQPILPLLSEAFGISPAQASLSVSVATVSLAASLVFAGPLADSLGRKPVMTWSMIATGVIGLVACLVPRYEVFLALRFLHGLVMAGLPSTAMAYLAEEIDPAFLGGAMGLYIAGNSIGGLTGRIVAGTLADFFNWQVAVGAIAVVSLICSLWFAKTLPPSRHFRPQPLKLSSLWQSILSALADPLLRTLYLIAALVMGSFVAFYNYISYHLIAPPYNLSSALVSWIFVLYLAGTFSSAWMGSLSDRHGRGPILTLSVLIQASGAAITLVSPLALKIVGAAVFTFGFFAAHSIASGWVGQRAKANRGTASSLYLFTYYLGSSVAGTTGGVVWSRFGWVGVVGFICALLLAALGLSALARKQALRPAVGASRAGAAVYSEAHSTAD